MQKSLTTLGLTFGMILACGAPGLAQAGRARPDDVGRARHERGEFRGERHERREFARSLRITAEQRAKALELAREFRPAALAARVEARKLVDEARAKNPGADRAAIRAAVREQIQGLRERLHAELEPGVRDLTSTLSPEQRESLEARAQKHGRHFDEDRFTGRTARLLARPRAVEFLERRQRTRDR